MKPLNDCKKYEENPFICDSSGEPKGQCAACGDNWYAHRNAALPNTELASPVLNTIRAHKGYEIEAVPALTAEEFRNLRSIVLTRGIYYAIAVTGSVKDPRFQVLRQACLNAQKALRDYINESN